MDPSYAIKVLWDQDNPRKTIIDGMIHRPADAKL